MENDIVSVAGAGAGVHLARPPFIDCDLPALVQQHCRIARCDVVSWVESVCLRLFDIDIAMMDNEEMSKRGDSVDEPTFRIAVWSVQQRRVLGGDKIEPGTRKNRVEQAGVNPFHIDVALLGGCSCTLQRDVGYVDRRDAPASACQPDGVGPLAAPHVESGTWFEVAHFGDEGTIGFTAPYLFDFCVPLVPFGVVSTDSFDARLMGTSKMVTVRLRMIGPVGHGPSSLPRESLVHRPGVVGKWDSA